MGDASEAGSPLRGRDTTHSAVHRSTRVWGLGRPCGEDEGREEAFTGTARFDVLRELGRGGMGTVYEVLDRSLGRRVALKTLRHQDGNYLARLKSEFRAVTGFVHPNLVHLGELFVGDDGWFFTMELVEGTDLLRAIRGPVPLLPGRALSADAIARLRMHAGQLAGALHALHRRGLLHLDLKPSNVIIEPSGRLVLLDFGLSRGRQEAVDAGSGATRGGTVAYMAPEQASGGQLGPAADWYGLGSTLFELLQGDVPFAGCVQDIVDAKVGGEAAPRLAPLCPWAPADLVSLIEGLLLHEPEDRPQARAVLQSLDLASEVEAAPALSSPFFGREEELDDLLGALREATTSGPVVLEIEGESGIGKSALLEAFRRLAAREGALVLRGPCRPREWVPFRAFDGLVDDLVRTLLPFRPRRRAALVPVDVRALVRLFPAFERVREFAEASADAAGQSLQALDDAALRRDAFEALDQVLESLRGPRTLVLLLDDVQWADRDSAGLLRFLLDRPGARALLVVLAARPGARSEPLLPAEAPRPRRVLLGGLRPAAAHALLSAACGPATPHLERLVEQSEGRPLWCRTLAAAAPHLADDERPPPSVDEFFSRSIAALPDGARSLLLHLALLGRPAARSSDTRSTSWRRACPTASSAPKRPPGRCVTRRTSTRSTSSPRRAGASSARCAWW